MANLTRTFVLFRELQSAVNPYSTCKPESIDYLAPYPGWTRTRRTRPPWTASRGSIWIGGTRRFFDRLHDFVGRAEALGVTVELTMFSNTYADPVWELNPLHHANNVNRLSPIHWTSTSPRATGRLRGSSPWSTRSSPSAVIIPT